MNQQGFTPVQRTDKRPGDFEYVWRNRELVAVRIERRYPAIKARGEG